MYLKELRLHGFKSFADPTRLDLRQGVTAIVGPNGCGKSNIADAIRWVLGEQSAKSLRAGAMQDVIFQGTSGRKPVNLCEVTLVFADCEESLGTSHHEVEVGRRVIRDGGSEYLLNGKPCRLKDIQNLFLDTGVGQVSYSFMLQGQIDQVLSSNPSERRAIFEEAAGISKYKAQRREALNKLGHVDANLSRVTDVIEEVARQTGSLKRQASKALRYQRIHHRLVHLDLAHNGYRFAEIKEEIDANRSKGEVLESQMAKLTAEIESAEASLSTRRNSALELRQQLEQSQKAVYDLRTEKENYVNRGEMAEYRTSDLKERQRSIKEELARLAEEEEVLARKLAGEAKAKEEQLSLFGNTDDSFKQQSEELAGLQKALNGAETELSRHKQALVAREGSVSRLRSNCTSLELDLKTYQVKHANLTEEVRNLENDRDVMERDLRDLEHAREKREKERSEQEDKLKGLREKREDLTRSYRDLQKSIQETERQRASLQARISMLEDLQAKFEGFSAGAKAILQGKLDDVVEPGTYLPFLKQLKVADGCTTAVEALLGNATDGVFLRDAASLRRLCPALAESSSGRASLLVGSDAQAGEQAPGGATLPSFLRAAGDVVSSEDPEIAAFINRYLGGCYIADELDPFLAFLESKPDFSFNLVVTPLGDLVDHRGVVLAGSRSAKSENASFLARQNQLKKAGKEQASVEENLERFRLQAEQLQGKLDAAEKRIEEQANRLSEIGTELTTLAAQRTGLQNTLATNRRNHEARRADLEKLESSKEASTGRLETARKELEETETSISRTKEQIASAESQVAELRQQREQKREAFEEARFEVAQKRQRLELLDRGLNELQQRSRENEQTRIKRLNESEQLDTQLESLAREQVEHRKAAGEVQEKLDGLMKKLESDRTALKEVEQKIAVVEEGFAPKRESQQALATELNKAEVALAKQESRMQFIGEKCREDYEREPGSIDWKLEFWKAGEELPERIRVDIEETTPEEMEALQVRPDPTPGERDSIDPVDWKQVEEEITSLRGRIQSMGPVNLVAIEEYKELKERHEFLRAQSDDLWKAKEQLLEAIDEINDTSEKLFADTFEKVKSNFHYTFETLFGGGKADLKLIDAEDVLESGIEITAQPPGTRLRNLGLLSGGQKTMTAVALLFAIYMVKPSPFCVLDEIDAPLDDANIGRFTGMLETFLEYSQFLIITHNKRTISVADTIYGTTMQEKGVSRMVSMRFNKATGKAEATSEVVTDPAQ